MTLQRKTPLRRTSTLQGRRSPVVRRYMLGESVESIAATMFVPRSDVWRAVMPAKRAALNPKSRQRKARDRVQRAVKLLLVVRDGDACRLFGTRGFGECGGPVEYHHLLKQGQTSSDDLSAAVLLCRSHNQRVEDQPDTARRLGLWASVKHGDTVADCWRRMHAQGLAVAPEPSRPLLPHERVDLTDWLCDVCLRRGVRGVCPSCSGPLDTGKGDWWAS